MHEWPDIKIRELAGANAYLREENAGQLMAAKRLPTTRREPSSAAVAEAMIDFRVAKEDD